MKIKKFDYSEAKGDIFYKIIYPIYAKEFLFGSKWDDFKLLVSANFVLSDK